jgi:hypothetical protein
MLTLPPNVRSSNLLKMNNIDNYCYLWQCIRVSQQSHVSLCSTPCSHHLSMFSCLFCLGLCQPCSVLLFSHSIQVSNIKFYLRANFACCLFCGFSDTAVHYKWISQHQSDISYFKNFVPW